MENSENRKTKKNVQRIKTSKNAFFFERSERFERPKQLYDNAFADLGGWRRHYKAINS